MIEKVTKFLFTAIGLFSIGSALLKLLYSEDIIIFGYPYIDKLLYILLIQIETILGLCLVFKPGKLIIYSGFIFILVFTVYSFLKIVSGTESNCGCFGSGIKRSATTAFKENLFLLFMYSTAMLLNGNKSIRIIKKTGSYLLPHGKNKI